MAGVNYYNRTVELRKQLTDQGHPDPVEMISRPGSGEPPKWHFTSGFVARGGPAAEAYLRGMVAGIALVDEVASDCC